MRRQGTPAAAGPAHTAALQRTSLAQTAELALHQQCSIGCVCTALLAGEMPGSPAATAARTAALKADAGAAAIAGHSNTALDSDPIDCLLAWVVGQGSAAAARGAAAAVARAAGESPAAVGQPSTHGSQQNQSATFTLLTWIVGQGWRRLQLPRQLLLLLLLLPLELPLQLEVRVRGVARKLPRNLPGELGQVL